MTLTDNKADDLRGRYSMPLSWRMVKWGEDAPVAKRNELGIPMKAWAVEVAELEALIEADRKKQAKRDRRLADLADKFDRLHLEFIQLERDGEEENGHEIAVYDMGDWDRLTDKLKGYTEVLAHLAELTRSPSEGADKSRSADEK